MASRVLQGAAVLVSLAALPALPALTQEPPGPPPACRGKLGSELFRAVVARDIQEVKALLARGADANARNSLEFTPLYTAAASGQDDMVEILLKAGAKLEAGSPFGTALTFAGLGGTSDTMQLLLAKGADPQPARADHITPLMLAARAGATDVVRNLLRRKVDPNGANNDGATALAFAARAGELQCARLLLDGGAKVDRADSRGWTPLMYAAVNGRGDVVSLLLARGAAPRRREARGRTVLQLTAAYGDYPDVARSLLKAGTAPEVARSAAAMAARRGHRACAAVLHGTGAPAMRTPRAAAELAVQRVRGSMQEFVRRTGCISCHHEGLGRMAIGAAREFGIGLGPASTDAGGTRVAAMVRATGPLHTAALTAPAALWQVPLTEIQESVTTYGWLLGGMAANGQPRTPEAGAMAMVMARQQFPNGSFGFFLPRPPMQSSFFSTTALAVQALRAYGPLESHAEIDGRVRRAQAWLKSAPAESTEDLAFRLLGLKWAGADDDAIRSAAAALRGLQRPDGGWAQVPGLQSDAYATGQALYALQQGGGVSAQDPAYGKGVTYLLRHQDDDGSWFVNKRATPANNYFDAGFPHGESQYSSFAGTCWATLALLQTQQKAPASKPQARR